MPLVSVTRLRIRSWRHLPSFAIDALRSRQAQQTPGFAGGWLGFAPGLAFWTVTAWRNEASMRAYRDKEAHKTAMPKLLDWCNEASVARYEQLDGTIPDGEVAFAEMLSRGRTSKVRHPTPAHAAGDLVPDRKAPRIGQTLRATGS